MQTIQLIPATPNDISTITTLANKIWNDYYVPIIGQNQVDYMLKLMYNANSIAEQMQIKQHNFYLIKQNNVNIGFVSVNRVEEEEGWFLNKFYILQTIASKGLGTNVFKLLKQQINPTKITLTVNRQNYKSINFYFKNGFKIKTVADFDIGNNYVMNDFVMEWLA